MKLSRIALRSFFQEWYERLLLGRWESLAGLLLFGLAVMAFLFATVHRRDLSTDLTKQYVYSAADPDRYPRLIRFWIEQGYLKHGGLWFIQPGDIGYIDENHPRVYGSGSMGYLQAAHLLERLSYALRGKFSYLPLMVHNQAIVWLSSALLGLLGMRLARRMEVDPFHALFFGIACTAIYQTFPSNLWYYWEIQSSTAAVPFILLFLLIEEISFGRDQNPRWFTALRGLSVFGVAYMDWLAGGLLITAYLLATLLLSPASLKRLHFLKTLLLPAVLAWGVYSLQILWVRLNFPNVEFVGSNFMFRTGFDGSTQYYVGFGDLWARRFNFFLPYLEPIIQPWFLFVAGGVAMVALAGLYLTRLPQLKVTMLLLATGLGLYGLYVSLFSQSAVIHPYIYDAYLTIPLVVALFSVLPASLERLTRNTGSITFLTVLMTFVCCMMQIRAYAVAFPLPNLPSGW